MNKTKLTTVLYDLDGTLLPMDMDEFCRGYFGALVKKMIPYGYNPEDLIAVIWEGVKEISTSNDERINEKVFWDCFSSKFGDDKLKDKPIFDEFYANEFDVARDFCGYNEFVPKLISEVKALGLRQAVATSPVFPQIATKKRIGWTGNRFEDFELVTTYENSHYGKPNLKYYEEILCKLDVVPEECLMVGNDVDEDMVAKNLGMRVFLVTDCLINKNNKDINEFPNGDFHDLLNYIKGEI